MGTVVPIKQRKAADRPQGDQARDDRKSDRHLAFTPQRLDALTRTGAQGYYYDTKMPGLAVRLGKSKTVYVQALRVGGTYQRRTLGNVASMLLADARLAVTAAAGSLAKGETLSSPRQAREAAKKARAAEQRRTTFTLEAAYEAFTNSRELKPNSRKTYAATWRHVPAGMRSTPFADLDAAAVAELHRTIGRKHKRAANKVVVLIASICNASGRRHDNPASDIRRYRETPRTRRLSPDETTRLRAVLETERVSEDDSRAMLAVLVSIALLTGARRSSIAAMRWADLDLRRGRAVWLIPAAWSKNNGELAVALTDEAAAILTAWKGRCTTGTWVFPSPGAAAGHVAEPKKGWRRIREAAGIDGLTLHDLRRSIGSEVAASGGNAATIASVLGHLSQQSARAYLHLNVGEARRALEKVRGRDA